MSARVDPWTYAEPAVAPARVSDETRGEVRAPGDVERARTRWRLDRQRNRRRTSLALDELCIRLYGADEAARYGIRDRRGRP